MQLIRITTTPIEYQFQVERAKMEVKQAENAQLRSTQTLARLEMKQQNIEVRLDTSAARSSIGLKDSTEFSADAARRGMRIAQETTGELTQMGNQMAQISDGVTVSSIISQKLLEQPQTQTVFLPSRGADISWEPNQLDITCEPGQIRNEWQIMQNEMNYVPGKFHMIIKQYPKVQIEYLGEPTYVPPSANPNYQGE